MNSTRWLTLSEFVKHLGREGLCRVEEGEKGFFVAWIDNSPEALRRQEFIRMKERQDRGDEQREQRAIREQIERANRDAEAVGKLGKEVPEEMKLLLREGGGEKIKLAMSTKSVVPSPEVGAKSDEQTKVDASALSATKPVLKMPPKKSSNVFSAMGKRKSKGKKEVSTPSALKRPMSEAERIMKEEMERKRIKGSEGPSKPLKRVRLG